MKTNEDAIKVAAGLIEAAVWDAVRLVGNQIALRLLTAELVSRVLENPETIPALAAELHDLDQAVTGFGIGRR